MKRGDTLEKLSFEVGELVLISGKHAELKREDGTKFPFVITEYDFLYITKVNEGNLTVKLREDFLDEARKITPLYGEFVIPTSILKSKDYIEYAREMEARTSVIKK